MKTMLWAIKIRYLESPYTGDGRWHSHTTKWYDNSGDAWQEAEEFESKHSSNWYECSNSLIHKERK